MPNVGTSNYAAYFGIPTITVSWAGRSATTRTGTIYTTVEKTNITDDSTTVDNSGEIQAVRTRNDRLQFRFGVKPVGANAAAALAIAGDLPKKNSIVIVTADAADTDFNATGTILVDEASTSYTPEGEATVNLTVTKHIGKTFAALS